jgi:hypothetical protein
MGFACVVVAPIAPIVSGRISFHYLCTNDYCWAAQTQELIETSYNSVVFSSIPSNSYFAFSVGKSFVSDPECLGCERMDLAGEFRAIDFNATIQGLHQSARDGTLDRLENSDCIDQYGKMFQTSRRHVLLVASEDNLRVANQADFPNGTNIYSKGWFAADDAMDIWDLNNIYNWICSGIKLYTRACYKEIGRVRDNPNSWVVNGYPVDHCLSERATPRCKLQLNTSIAILVTALNLFKAILMFCTVLLVKEDPLMTMGDAVASFMTNNDMTTKNMCLLTNDDTKTMFVRTGNNLSKSLGHSLGGAKKWSRTTYRWKDVTSIRRRLIAFAM